MAAYAEGFNLLHEANAGQRAHARRRRDGAAHRARRAPRVRLRPRGDRRALAPRQRRPLVAARSRSARRSRAIRSSTVFSAKSRTPARAAGRSTRPSTPAFRCPCSRPRCSRGSARAATTISRTDCCRRCDASSAAMSSAAQRRGSRACVTRPPQTRSSYSVSRAISRTGRFFPRFRVS